MIAFPCVACARKLAVKEELVGKKVRCPGCGNVISVPSPPGEARHDPRLTDFLAPAQAEDELGRLGGFRILKILGHGGMGVVFQGEDPKLGRPVAIKVMLPRLAASKSAQERFLREGRTAAALEHDHVVRILQVGEDRGAPFIVMPFLKGEPLDGRLRDEPLPLSEVLRIGREIAEALAAAHERGLIHRDIKPANVWLEATRQRVKILDFGLARVAVDDAHLTRTGAILGTPAYMAPEQGRGERVDARGDLLSLGVVLYRMCTGTTPFKGHDTFSTLLAVATHHPPAPAEVNPEVPPGLSHLVMALLAKDPNARPASAQTVAHLLAELEQASATVPADGISASKPAASRSDGRSSAQIAPRCRHRSARGKAPPWSGGPGCSPRPSVPPWWSFSASHSFFCSGMPPRTARERRRSWPSLTTSQSTRNRALRKTTPIWASRKRSRLLAATSGPPSEGQRHRARTGTRPNGP